MKQFLLICCILCAFESFSQEQKIIKHTENSDLNLAIKEHDSLLNKFGNSYFTLKIDSKKVNTYTHLNEFYKSKEVFLKDSLHAKKQLQILKLINTDCYDHNQLPKILAKAREYRGKGEKEKALELYKRGLLLSEYDDELKKEFEQEYEALKKEMGK